MLDENYVKNSFPPGETCDISLAKALKRLKGLRFYQRSVEGALIVTTINISAWIYDLRVCWAETGADLISAIDCYSLFVCDPSAREMLAKN